MDFFKNAFSKMTKLFESVYNSTHNGPHLSNSPISGDNNFNTTNITINGGMTGVSKTPLTSKDIAMIKKWVNRRNQSFSRVDTTSWTSISLGSDNKLVLQTIQEKEEVEAMFERFLENGLVRISDKKKGHNWYELTDKAYNEYKDDTII